MKKIILSALLLVLPCTSSAEDLSGVYVGVSGGLATLNGVNYTQKIANSIAGLGYTSTFVKTKHRSVSYKVFAGYNINEKFAVEVFYSNLGSYNITLATTGPVRSGTGSNKVKAYGVDVLAKLPIAETNSMYLRVGYFQAKFNSMTTANLIKGSNINVSSKSSNVKFGVGGDYGLTENWSVRTDWEYYNVPSTPINVFSLGLVANF
ncbi:MAG: porin family protein [Mariprofundaceae bacterium]|nr:porin family protein [Mariprofundaceae bacterium]